LICYSVRPDYNIITYKELLREELKKDLPGTSAQFKMAPGLRLRIKPDSDVKKAAVLILIYPDGDSLSTVFIRRPKYTGMHSGQISLPGGKMEQNDSDLTVTALREAEEEIGINRNDVEILGQLSQLFIPVSNMLVSPVIGYISDKPVFRPQQGEVVELIETPVKEFLQPGVIQFKIKIIRFTRAIVPFYNIHGHQIWGATAMIISEFTELLQRIDSHR
jgi:8-oxo-dGTP pyrophosphatase MutT (NUDIX family)